jgi:hypothetical protein
MAVVPDMERDSIQEILELFPAADFDSLIKSAGHEEISIQVNTRLKASWRLMLYRDGRKILIIPPVLMNAPADIKKSLIKWSLYVSRRRRDKVLRQHKHAEETSVRNYLASRGHIAEKSRPVNKEKFKQAVQGKTYNLEEVFSNINNRYFNGSLVSLIRWGGAGTSLSYQINKPDENGNQLSFITIGKVYDHPSVPQFAVEGVVFHEMCHIVVPPVTSKGQRIIHGKAFKELERTFPYFEKWRTWEKENMRKLRATVRREATKEKKRKLKFF